MASHFTYLMRQETIFRIEVNTSIQNKTQERGGMVTKNNITQTKIKIQTKGLLFCVVEWFTLFSKRFALF